MRCHTLFFIFSLFFSFGLSNASGQGLSENDLGDRTFYELISTCAAGAEIRITGDMEGSLRDFLSGQSFQGEGSIITQTEWLRLFEPQDRIAAAGLYHACLKDIIDILIKEKEKQTRNNKMEFMTKLAYFCSPFPNSVAKVYIDGVYAKSSPDIMGKLTSNYKSLLGDFFVGKDSNIYIESPAINEFITQGRKSDTETNAQLAAFRASGIKESVHVLVLYSHEPVRTKIDGRDVLERKFLFFIDFGPNFVVFFQEVFVDESGRRHVIDVRQTVARCTADVVSGLRPEVTGEPGRISPAQPGTSALSDQCDRLAGNEYDSHRNVNFSAVPYRLLSVQAQQAIQACRDASDEFPQQPRFRYQLARALQTQASPEAKEILTPLVIADYPAAYDNLGWMHFREGRIREAIELFKKGAALESVESMVSYGNFLLEGKWIAKNSDLALHYFTKAAELGHPYASEQVIKLQRIQEVQKFGRNLLSTILDGIVRDRR